MKTFNYRIQNFSGSRAATSTDRIISRGTVQAASLESAAKKVQKKATRGTHDSVVLGNYVRVSDGQVALEVKML